MGVDEEGTHERLKAHRREFVDPKIGEHSGRIVKTTGDGMLVEFASVVDAVRCAAEVQRAMIDREVGMPEDRRIRFRIGINLGDVIVEEGDIFGDGEVTLSSSTARMRLLVMAMRKADLFDFATLKRRCRRILLLARVGTEHPAVGFSQPRGQADRVEGRPVAVDQ
jgi:hypothetical protein